MVSKHVRETALKERWNEAPAEVEALLHRDRYRKLHELLTSGRVEIRVVPKDRVFIHGKAGVIEAADGTKTCFLGSINETKSAFAHNYEILWEDPSPEGVAWVEEEFDALWKDSFPLPDAIIEEIKRVADRVEIRFADVAAGRTARRGAGRIARSTEAASNSSPGSVPSSPCSSSTARPTAGRACSWRMKWAWARPCRSPPAP